ncbi:hypothetical protein ESCO_004724 [Escovopsis weberi]|uniref:Uncharacterized protein n=1 Tax=Escovopsis weberi TaxID=150374 RepID=A0A0M8MZQ3_ESCWE|nr:hypothetical protein ESCO_004724 [Escovopsis weberi]
MRLAPLDAQDLEYPPLVPPSTVRALGPLSSSSASSSTRCPLSRYLFCLGSSSALNCMHSSGQSSFTTTGLPRSSRLFPPPVSPVSPVSVVSVVINKPSTSAHPSPLSTTTCVASPTPRTHLAPHSLALLIRSLLAGATSSSGT